MRALAKRFVCVADEVFRLQKGKDADARFFRSFCEEGHYGGRKRPSNTRQGIYCVSADGSFLASINTRKAASVARMMREALDRFAKLPAKARRASDARREELGKVQRIEARFPEDGLVLRVATRDLPGTERQQWWHEKARNLDWAWFLRKELYGLLPVERDADTWKLGARVPVDAELVERVVRCHLVDNVRGQTSAFGKRDVRRAELEVWADRLEGSVVHLRYAGKTLARAESGAWPRGFETKLEGRARWDREKGRFTEFVLVAEGERWGRTRFNSREQRRKRSRTPKDDASARTRREPIAVLLELLPATQSLRVAPAHIWSYGWR